MSWDAKAKGVAIKAIGTVESGMRYDDINHNDPITIGIGQWFGGRAYNLLARIKREAPDEYAKLPAELRSRVDANNTDWPHYYLPNYMDGQVKPVLRACYKIQQKQMADDLEAYVAIARKFGFDPDRDTQSMIFFFVAYHQTPVRAMRIANQIGPATLDRWHAAALNEPIFGRYRNRYNTAYNIIKAWNSDGVDIAGPPGAAPSNPTQGDGGNGAPGANQPLANGSSAGQLARVEEWGNTLAQQRKGRSQRPVDNVCRAGCCDCVCRSGLFLHHAHAFCHLAKARIHGRCWWGRTLRQSFGAGFGIKEDIGKPRTRPC